MQKIKDKEDKIMRTIKVGSIEVLLWLSLMR